MSVRNGRHIRSGMGIAGTLLGSVLWALTGCPAEGPPPETAGAPEEVVRLNVVGTSLLSQQKWAEAQEQFLKAIELRPDDPVPLVNMAVALVQQAREDEAAEYLERALRSDPDHPWAHYDLGLIEKNRGNLDAAIVHLSKVVETDPDDVAARYNLATVLGRVERFEEAEAQYRAALELNPTHVSSLYGLGRLLLQQGKQERGVELVSRSQEIRAQSGIDTAMGTQYGEQGPYAMGVDYPGGGLAAPEPLVVTFTATTQADLVPSDAASAAYVAALTGAFDGEGRPGVAVGDVDADGEVEIVALDRASDGWEVAVFDPGSEATATRSPLGIALRPDSAAADLTLVDRDHDGDLDLFGCSAEAEAVACFLADNDGAGRFAAAERDPGVGVAAAGEDAVAVSFSDYDNDRDVDLIVASPSGVFLFSNLRDGTFADVTEETGLGASLPGARSLEVADLDKNGFMDLVVGTVRGPVLAFNEKARFRIDAGLASDAGGPETAAGAVVLDHDNDGFLDVAAASGGGLGVHRNEGVGRWGAVSPVAGAGEASPLAAVDVDADGDLDLYVATPSGPGVLVNEGGNANRWIRIRTEGVNDNKLGIGTKLEVLAGALRQKFEIRRPVPLHAGLGGRDEVDAVRFLWPGGVLQDELHLATGEEIGIAQLDRKGTSCPLLYAWRGDGWKFVTDFLGGCAIGYRHSPDTLSVPDTDEYVLIEGGLEERDGTLPVRLNNQLEEVIWFDKTELVVVDHPEGTVVYPNERLMPGPPWPEFSLFASSDVRAVGSAREVETGRDVTGALRERDRDYVDGFELLPFKGYAEMHTLEIDVGELPRDERVILLLDGWIDYADSTANVAAHQAGARLVPPRLSFADGRGGFHEADDRMGFPAGLPKTMVVDLTGKLSTGDPRLRIETTMRIYWDRARVMVGGADTPLRVTRLLPQSAELRFGGFPSETSPDGEKPFAYDPERVGRVSPWKAHEGAYTDFGDVRELVGAIDDRFVTTVRGDEIELRFDAPEPPPEGWVRSYLLFADGFGKDMDPNSAAASRVGPIPFHGMPTYPYGPEVVPPATQTGTRRVFAADDGLPGVPPLASRVHDGDDR